MSAVQQLISSYGALVDFNLNAVDFDGSTEGMANTTAQTVGIANAFTISIWMNTSGANGQIFEFRNFSSDLNNFIDIAIVSNQFRVALYNSSGSIFKDYKSSLTFNDGNNVHALVTWDGTTLSIYKNSTLDSSPTKTTDSAGTMTDSVRKTYIGSNVLVNTFFAGKIAKCDVWNASLSSTEGTALYDSGNGYKLDVRNSKGNYTSTANLKHQWAPGKDGTTITTMGTDYVSSGTINIGTNAANISSADIVTF